MVARFEAIPVESIRTDPATPEPSRAAVDVMVHSFRSRGQLQAICLDSTNLLLFGRIRLEAARVLGWETINSEIRDDVADSDDERFLIRLEENTVRGSELRPSEIIRAAKDHVRPLLEAGSAKQRAAAAERGRATRYGSGDAELGGAKFAQPSEDHALLDEELGGANFAPPSGDLLRTSSAPSIAAVAAAPGKTRKKYSDIFNMSGDTVEKLLAMDDAAENDALPEEIRAFVREEIAQCDVDGKINPHYEAAQMAVTRAFETEDDRAERERSNRLTRLNRPLSEAVNALRNLTVEQLVDILVNDDAGEADWETVLELAAEANSTLMSLTARARERIALT
ncbi:ParB N-terminal domain-containing protein [Leifsonia aquatica]|uniref:ParB N-terminal domain-containing protein n=1 Tax=Leifsonia aquatica TaxID=144185 RepID=UPI00384F8F3B